MSAEFRTGFRTNVRVGQMSGYRSNKVLRYNSVNNVWTCQNCISNIQYRYNPFASLYATTSHANHEPVTDDSDIQKINDILENCNYHY